MDNKKYEGHEGTNKPPNAPQGYSSPATHAPLSQDPSSVNTKTDMGSKGK